MTPLLKSLASLGVLGVLLGGGWWLRGELEGLRQEISDSRSQVIETISNNSNNRHVELLDRISFLDRRVSMIEGRLQVTVTEANSKFAELQKGLAILDVESRAALVSPTSAGEKRIAGTVKAINRQKNTITIQDIRGQEFKFSVAADTPTKLLSTAGEKKISLKEIKPGNPVVITHTTTHAGEKVAASIGKSPLEIQDVGKVVK